MGEGGFETITITRVPGSRASRSRPASSVVPPISSYTSRLPVPMACETPSPSAWMRQVTSCMPVPDAPTMPIAPRRTAFAKPSGTPPMIAVPQSGPITSRPFFEARRLTACSSASGTLSLKRKTCRPRLSAFSVSAAAYGPGTEICASVARSRRSTPIAIERGAISVRSPAGAVSRPASCSSIAASAAASASCSPSTRIMRSAGAAATSSGTSRPACARMSLFAGVPISSDTRPRPARAPTVWAMRISATESL